MSFDKSVSTLHSLSPYKDTVLLSCNLIAIIQKSLLTGKRGRKDKSE